jgi:hypothetical protein
MKQGCKYFIVGNNGFSENCFQEHTISAACQEGWDRDSYDFYQLKGKYNPLHKYVSETIFTMSLLNVIFLFLT